MGEAQIIQDRLARIMGLPLAAGSHATLDEGMCVMEAVAWIAGEPWSDSPACACPVITAFMVAWNDGLPSDAERDRLLKPLVPKIVGTRGGKKLEERRALMAADWLIRVHTPAWLRLAGLTKQADTLAGLPEITDVAKVSSIQPTLEAVRKDADAAWDAARAAARDATWDATWDAAWAAARDATWDAARDATWDAARAAARDAARAVVWAAAWDATWAAARDAARDATWAAARDAARDAAWDAAWDAAKDATRAAARDATRAAAWDAARAAAKDATRAAARDATRAATRAATWDAARAAAWDALQPTQTALQASAIALVERMIAAKDEEKQAA